METTTAAAPQRGRRHLGALRSLSPAAIAVTLALLVGGGGIADAATGGNFILGKTNRETSTASLTDSAGTPLKLSAPAGKAPLAVNSATMVHNLNAQYVGGLSAADLAATGGDGYTSPNTDTPMTSTAVQLASTGPLPAGTYYVTATALLFVASGDLAGFCYITNGSHLVALGGSQQPGYGQAAETTAVRVPAGGSLQEWCFSDGASGSRVNDAGITAIRVLSSSGTPPASAAHRSMSPQ